MIWDKDNSSVAGMRQIMDGATVAKQVLLALELQISAQ